MSERDRGAAEAAQGAGAARPPRNVTSVGGLVVRDDCLLVVRMAYGPSQGRYMLPGGIVDPGETLDAAAAREVREETGIEARPLGIVGVRSRVSGLDNDTYVLWLLEPLPGEPLADGREVEHCCFLSFDEIAAREDVVYLVKYLAARLRAGALAPQTRASDYAYQLPGTTPETWKLFV
jgi:8-oxo-dGTP pyrophosphatase MutT (NUDIX family)